jgi:hypothetical protein
VWLHFFFGWIREKKKWVRVAAMTWHLLLLCCGLAVLSAPCEAYFRGDPVGALRALLPAACVRTPKRLSGRAAR